MVAALVDRLLTAKYAQLVYGEHLVEAGPHFSAPSYCSVLSATHRVTVSFTAAAPTSTQEEGWGGGQAS